MAEHLKKCMAGIIIGLLLMPGQWVYAAAAEAEVVSISEAGSGVWKVVMQAKDGPHTLTIGTDTTIKKEVPVEQIKRGDRLLRSSGRSGGGGSKTPFSNMSEGTKRMLGLPNIPAMPQLPDIPKIPKNPAKQELQGVAAAKNAQGAVAAVAGEPAQGGKQTAAKEPLPEVKTQDQILEEKGFQNEKLLFAPEPGKEAPQRGDEVLQVKKTDKGFELTIAAEKGEKKLTYPKGKRLLTALSPDGLKAKDRVEVEFGPKKTISGLFVKS